MKKIITPLLAFLLISLTNAQTNVQLTINHKLGAEDFQFNTEVKNNIDHTIKFQRFEYYISGISIIHDGRTETNLSDVYILANAGKNETHLLGNLDVTDIESISFSVGVDPNVNNADPSQWSADHALSPKFPSMHWGWASGYRFVAIEGKSGSSFNQDFQIHALGNKNYFKQNIPVSGTDDGNGGLLITLNADYIKAVSNMAMNNGLIEHGENNEAITCLRFFQNDVFTNVSGEGNTLKTKHLKQNRIFTVFPNPTDGKLQIRIKDPKWNASQFVIRNHLGQVIQNGVSADNGQTIKLNHKGLYWLTLSKNGDVHTEKVIVK